MLFTNTGFSFCESVGWTLVRHVGLVNQILGYLWPCRGLAKIIKYFLIVAGCSLTNVRLSHPRSGGSSKYKVFDHAWTFLALQNESILLTGS